MESIQKFWDDRTIVVRSEVVLEIQKTILFGFLTVWRQKIFVLPNPQATINRDTPTQTFRTVFVGPLRFTYQLPVFVENWLNRDQA
jgi:hypothetical protein